MEIKFLNNKNISTFLQSDESSSKTKHKEIHSVSSFSIKFTLSLGKKEKSPPTKNSTPTGQKTLAHTFLSPQKVCKIKLISNVVSKDFLANPSSNKKSVWLITFLFFT